MEAPYRVVGTKQFSKCIRELVKKGKKGKDAKLKALAAQAEAAVQGAITILPHTKWGESRLSNVEKYDLGDGYRLVVQLIDTGKKHRAFLFVGDHEDADAWLENHKNYQWVRNEGDSTLEFVQVSFAGAPTTVVPDVDTESPEALLELPLLRDIAEPEWSQVRAPAAVTEYLKSITGEDWEQDPNGIADHVATLSDMEWASFAIDALHHAHKREWDALNRRFEVAAGESKVVDGAEAADAMVDPANSENFVTWDDIEGIPEGADWADWMLFLHPEQKDLAVREFNGPTRLRGVSGSGKTTVMVHRARHLAKKYRQDILLVTLTESSRRLLDLLVRCLCGAEAAHIKTATMNYLATDAIEALAPGGLSSYSKATDAQMQFARAQAISAVRQHPAFGDTVLSKIPATGLEDFIVDEVAYVRMRLLPAEYEKYRTMPRHGRGVPLPEKARVVALAAVEAWDKALGKYRAKDYDGVVQSALLLLGASASGTRNTFCYRCVLVDEVQDLSQLEMRVLSLIPDSQGKRIVDLQDGFFLVGDGAQTIYKKGFSLKHCGVAIANRSFALKKNYRNTREVLEAAYGLIKEYEFADVDEENVQRPIPPDLSSRHGEKPFIVKCSGHRGEAEFVVTRVRELIDEQRMRDEAMGLQQGTEIPICVIGFTPADRDRVQSALQAAGIPTTELRQDVAWDSNAVKLSTLESAKGHEFHAVFIVGVKDSTIPHYLVEKDDWKREAARLYVAMTRARDQLYLSYDVGGRYGPSPFLSAIQHNCQEYEFKNGRLASVQ